MLFKCTQIILQLHILNLLLQGFVSDKIYTWKTYILWQGFKVNSMCDTYT
jgi:hypothetical protein